MACDCIRLMDEALRRENLRLVCAHWFSRETGAYRATVRIGTELIERKRGQRPSTMIPDFCPFCGTRYEAVEEGER
jgi:hypothetical protein